MKKLFNIAVLLLFSIIGTAQKLIRVQEAGLRAPENVKTDGRTTEWKNKFQAYNNSTQVFYTIANNDEKLYLVVQATDALVIRKIIAGGITLSISPVDSKRSKDVIAITYPLFNKKNWPEINVSNRPLIIKDTSVNIERIDSFIRASNYQLDNRSKEIKITGAKDLKDTLVSIYNEVGIKAVSQFNQRTAYTYELSIPFKYLGLSIGGQESFSYKLTLNGSNFAEGNIIEDIKGGNRITTTGNSKLVPMNDMLFMRYPTYLTGSYKLAKK